MKRSFIIIFTILSSISAIGQTDIKATANYVYKTDSSKTNDEYIDWDSARINGKLPLESNTKDLYRLLGQPDSIITPNFDDVSVRFMTIKNSKLYISKEVNLKYMGTQLL